MIEKKTREMKLKENLKKNYSLSERQKTGNEGMASTSMLKQQQQAASAVVVFTKLEKTSSHFPSIRWIVLVFYSSRFQIKTEIAHENRLNQSLNLM